MPENRPSQYKGEGLWIPSTALLESKFNPEGSLDAEDLDDREREVLGILSSNHDTFYSFQGLRRRLGIHQETLARTLKRLEEANMIERTSEGYRINETNKLFSFSVNTQELPAQPVIEAFLPAQADVTILFQKLRGRWFSDFRWLGYSREAGSVSMRWVSEDGRHQVQAQIGEGKIKITSEAHNGQDDPFRVTAAYELFDYVSKVAEEIMHERVEQAVPN